MDSWGVPSPSWHNLAPEAKSDTCLETGERQLEVPRAGQGGGNHKNLEPRVLTQVKLSYLTSLLPCTLHLGEVGGILGGKRRQREAPKPWRTAPPLEGGSQHFLHYTNLNKEFFQKTQLNVDRGLFY
jgi:hypothetical protein